MVFGIELGADAFSRRTFLQSWYKAIVPRMACALPVSNIELVLLFPCANGIFGSSLTLSSASRRPYFAKKRAATL